MGISAEICIVYGVAIEWNPDTNGFAEAYDLVSDTCTLDILFDTMAGEYIILGPNYYRSGDIFEPDEREDARQELNMEYLAEDWDQYVTDFNTTFPDFAYLLADAEPKVIAITHYY